MDDPPSSLPLTIKSGAVRDTPDTTATYTRCSHTRLSLQTSQSQFSLPPPWQEAQVKLDRTKEIKMKLQFKHMDRADSRFSVVRADHPGRADSIEE